MATRREERRPTLRASGRRTGTGAGFVKHRAHLRAQRGGVAFVADNMMRASALLVKWPLGGLTAGEFLGGPASVGADALQAQFQQLVVESPAALESSRTTGSSWNSPKASLPVVIMA